MFGETNKSPEFLKKFPLGKVPAFEGSDGLLLTESNAIAYYVANDELRGGSEAAARAQVGIVYMYIYFLKSLFVKMMNIFTDLY